MKPVAFPSAASRQSPLRSAAQLGQPRLALYSLTGSARTPFHAEPTHSETMSASTSEAIRKAVAMRNSLQNGQFYGEVSQRSALPGLVLTETRYSPHLHIPSHSHENAYFCFILGGAYTEVYGNKTRRCVPFTLAFHPPAELHSENFEGTEVRSFNVEVGPSAI